MIIPFYYFFFTIGITSLSKFFFTDDKSINNLKSGYLIPIKPIGAFICLLVYSSFSNFILLIPLLIRYLSKSNEVVIGANIFSQYFIMIQGIFN